MKTIYPNPRLDFALVTAQNPSYLANKEPRKMFHGLDQAAAFTPMTKHIEIVGDVGEITGAVNRVPLAHYDLGIPGQS